MAAPPPSLSFAFAGGSKELHQLTGSSMLASSVSQSFGAAPGTIGYVNITENCTGRVTFAVEDTGGAPSASFIKAVKELPYDLAIIQIRSPRPRL